MIDRDHGLSLSRQAEALGISRGAIYYRAQATSADDLALMRRIDELHLDHPFAGSRMLKGLLNAEGHEVGRLHVSTLMKGSLQESAFRARQMRTEGERRLAQAARSDGRVRSGRSSLGAGWLSASQA